MTLKIWAYQAGWAPSATLTATFVVDGDAPTIQVRVVPAPIDGWHHTAPTVSFVCADQGSGVAACPEPVVVSTDGAGQLVAGTAYDAAGNATATSVTINLDRVAPAVAITTSSPASSPTAASTATIEATVSDALSGLQSARCNAEPATITQGTVVCAVPLAPGRNSVIVDVLDAAGNSSSASLHLTRVDAPTALRISPTSMTLVVGDERLVQVLDDFGQSAPTGLTWATDDALIADVEDRPEGPTVVGRGIGSTDITASIGGLAQTLQVTVLGGTTMPVGTWAWTSPPGGGAWTNAVAPGAPDRDGTTVLALEEDAAGGLIRAVGPLGHTKWQMRVPGSEVAQEAIALADGGVVLRTPSAIVRVPHPDGGPAWRFPASVSGTGRTPNGDIVALIQTPSLPDRELVSLDGASGAVRWRHALPRNPGHVTLNVDCSMGYDIYGDETAASATGLTIDELGTTYLYVATDYAFFDYAAGGQCEMYAVNRSGDLSLMTITDGGGASVTSLRAYAVSHTAPAMTFELPTYTAGLPGTMVPVAGGGVVATRSDVTFGGGGAWDTIVTSHGAAGSFTNHYPSEVRVVADAEAGHVVVAEDDQVHLVQTTSGATMATFTGELVEVLADNEVLLAQGGQVEHRDATGGLVQAGAATLQGAVRVAQAIWAKVDSSAFIGVGGLNGLLTHPANALVGPGVVAAAGLFGYPAVPVVRNLTEFEIVVKRGGCYAGFAKVPPHGTYYRWVDGVIPGAVTGWNAADWFKVPDLAHVVVHPNGAQPTAHGPSTVLVPAPLPGSGTFCRQDDPSQANYKGCWGRRVEPLWSTPEADGGFDAIDWRYPRIKTDLEACGPYPNPLNVKAWW